MRPRYSGVKSEEQEEEEAEEGEVGIIFGGSEGELWGRKQVGYWVGIGHSHRTKDVHVEGPQGPEGK